MAEVNFKLEIPTIDCYFFNPFSDQEELAKDLEKLTKLYDERPFDNTGGIKFAGAFAYYCLLKRIAPTVVIESGILRGFSTYIIEQTLPDSSLICLDP